MRLFDETNDRTLKSLVLLLTMEEARELRDDLGALLQKTDTHAHVDDSTYEHEVTVAIYDPQRLKGFNDRIVKVIIDDA